MTNIPPPPPPPPPMGNKQAVAPAPSVDVSGMITVPQANPNAVYAWTIIGVEGWGKTSMVAHIPNVCIVQVGEETGYQSLLNAGRVPAVPTANVRSWDQTIAVAEHLATSQFDAIAWDAAGGLEQLCFDSVCAQHYKGDWDKFMSYAKGPDVAVPEWLRLLSIFERAKNNGKTVILLSHAQIKPHNDPMLSESYDRYIAAMNKRTWGATHKWTDEALFCTFLSDVEKEKGQLKAKGRGGTQRVIYSRRCDAYDAKDRLGLPEFMIAPENPADVWNMIQSNRKANANV